MATFNKGMKYLRHKIIEDLKEIRKHILWRYFWNYTWENSAETFSY